MSKIQKLTVPEFLLCEIPIKNKTIEDNRLFINCTRALSLIECICVNDIDVAFNVPFTEFKYKNEVWHLYIVQNNCNITNVNEKELLNKAFNFLSQYFEWEDKNIDNSKFTSLN